MKRCKHCQREVPDSHDCPTAGRTIDSSDSSDFIMSAAIGALTDNALLGAALGGSISGGIVGDMLGGDSGFF